MKNQEKSLSDKIEIDLIKVLEEQVSEYRKLYASAILVREKQFIELFKEREELLKLILEYKKQIKEMMEKN